MLARYLLSHRATLYAIINYNFVPQIKCAHVLYKKTRKTAMSFPEVAEAALDNGPQGLRKWAYTFR